MRRIVAALALALLSSRAPAQETPPATPASPAPQNGIDARPTAVDPVLLQKKADDLRDAVADPGSSLYRLHADAGALFNNVQSQTPVRRPHARLIERENVDGRIGTLDGMIEAANRRFDAYKLRFHAPPPPDATASAETAVAFKEQGRADFDKKNRLTDEQMGVFRYAPADVAGGVIELNRRLALIATRIGEAFAYSTLVHEATHARDRAAGKLSPEHAKDGEVNAFRVEYLWLTTMDPTGMRLIDLQLTLDDWTKRHPKDVLSAHALAYVQHLTALRQTGGEEKKLRKFVDDLGYEDDPDKPAAPTPSPVKA